MNPLNLWTFDLFVLAACLYTAGFGFSLAHRRAAAGVLLVLGLTANTGSLVLRLYTSWPMQAPYQEPFWLPASLAVLACWFISNRDRGLAKSLVGMAAAAAVFSLFFPKDYYLPFPRSATVFAHVFLLVSAASKGFLLAGGAAAGLWLHTDQGSPLYKARRSLFGNLIIWGFVLYSLGLFIAQAWSYLGWASPVIFDEYTITSSMATWFYYGCFLHLFLLKRWKAKRRAWFGLAGAPLMIYFNYLPETGMFKWPVLLP